MRSMIRSAARSVSSSSLPLPSPFSRFSRKKSQIVIIFFFSSSLPSAMISGDRVRSSRIGAIGGGPAAVAGSSLPDPGQFRPTHPHQPILSHAFILSFIHPLIHTWMSHLSIPSDIPFPSIPCIFFFFFFCFSVIFCPASGLPDADVQQPLCRGHGPSPEALPTRSPASLLRDEDFGRGGCGERCRLHTPSEGCHGTVAAVSRDHQGSTDEMGLRDCAGAFRGGHPSFPVQCISGGKTRTPVSGWSDR